MVKYIVFAAGYFRLFVCLRESRRQRPVMLCFWAWLFYSHVGTVGVAFLAAARSQTIDSCSLTRTPLFVCLFACRYWKECSFFLMTVWVSCCVPEFVCVSVLLKCVVSRGMQLFVYVYVESWVTYRRRRGSERIFRQLPWRSAAGVNKRQPFRDVLRYGSFRIRCTWNNLLVFVSIRNLYPVAAAASVCCCCYCLVYWILCLLCFYVC